MYFTCPSVLTWQPLSVCQCADLKHLELMLHPQLNLFQFTHPRNGSLNQARHLHANSISEIYVTNVLVMVIVTEGDVRQCRPTFKPKEDSVSKVLGYMVYLSSVDMNVFCECFKTKYPCV